MAESALLLGPILFQDFELPERVRWGGRQKLTVHRLPGGVRVIDSLGRDDADIVWSGVFSGTDAALRARAVDLMRADGGFWPLTWNLFFYTVVISRFDADYARSNWIPYRIACTVVRDEAAALVECAVSLATSVLGDLGAAQALGCGVVLDTAIGSIGVTQATQPGSSAYVGASAALAGASRQVDAGIAETQGQLSVASVSDAARLNATADLAGQLAALTAARGYVRRAGANLAYADT
jgi:hypothetical protein